MSQNKIDQMKIENLKPIEKTIEKRLLVVPNEIKRWFPPILLTNCSFYVFQTSSYLLVSFVDKYGLGRINDLVKEEVNPFPGMVREKDDGRPPAVYCLNAQNEILQNVNINYGCVFSFVPDTSCIITNLFQSVRTEQESVLSYHLQLGYLLMFGEVFDERNVDGYFDSLVAYSVKQWRASNKK